MNLAVFGSHKGGINRTLIEDYLTERFDPRVTVFSGGAAGVDTYAEEVWGQLGGTVISFRPRRIKGTDEFSYERHILEPGKPPVVWRPNDALTFLDWESAAFYRSWVMADEAERGVCWIHGWSPGSRFTIDRLRAQGKPVVVKEV